MKSQYKKAIEIHGLDAVITAQTLLACEGFSVGANPAGMMMDRPELLKNKADLRRAMNTLSAKQRKQSDPKLLDQMLVAMEVCAAWVNDIDHQIEGNDEARRSFGGEIIANDWRNGDGGVTPILRNEADIRDFYAQRAADSSFNQDERFSFADWMRGVAGMKIHPAVQNALSVGTDASGGFAVPTLLMPGILGAMVPASSLMRAGVGFVPLDTGAKSYVTAAINAIPTAAWRLEAGAVATSDPAFRAVSGTPRSLSFMFKISRELLADGEDMSQALSIVCAQAAAVALDKAGLRGSGTAPEPRGILNTSGIQAVTNGTNGAAPTSYANFLSAIQSLLTADCPMPNAAIMHPRTLVKLAGLLDTTNQPMRAPALLDMVSFLTSSQIPINLTVGSSSDCSEIYMGDFTQMVFVMREALRIQVADQLYAATGEVAFICHMRADVVVKYPAAFAVVTGIRA